MSDHPSHIQYLPKTFEPGPVEQKWTSFWDQHRYFESKPDSREPFTVVIPPPNVTGVLHMGHMLNNTIQDVLVRRARMLGKNACWVPGTDHASIATEAKVVHKLREQGIKKSDLSREDFLAHAWEWTDKHGGIILKQLKTLGASCDWSRTRFTLEPSLYEAVIDCFIDLYNRGLIYRGLRMVNWDPQAKTALSDEEVIYKEQTSKLYHVAYSIEGSTDCITIATTRPETILADTAICVHPNDERYKHLIGQFAIVPLEQRRIPIIADEYVEMEFGTGCLKVTPAHDPNDYMLGQKHQLQIIDMFTPDAIVNDQVTHFTGLDRFQARKAMIKALEESGALQKVEDIHNKVGYSERTDALIEPRLSLQWFLKMEEISKPALENVMNDSIRFHPDKFKNSYRNWMENIHDWCISRQLWWGHRIPAWYYGDAHNEYVIAKTEEEALLKAKEKTGKEFISLKQDEDVLDTWFSSWLWPISVFGGIHEKENAELNYYYPTQDLVTAPEIMFFWVARMIIAGYLFRGEKPFSNVYYHGIVRDKQRRKMSKSLGNSPDPLDLIAQFGADGTRAGMLFSAPAGNDLLFDEALCEQGRNFANKLWNAFRFLAMNMEEGETYQPTTEIDSDNLADRWMLSRIHQVLDEMNADFDRYRLNEALQKIYALLWDDFCDWYIELCKPEQYGQKIPKAKLERALGLFELMLKMLHPFMPFITEEIWQSIRERGSNEALTISHWPQLDPTAIDASVIEQFTHLQNLVSGLRNMRSEMNISPAQVLTLQIKPSNEQRSASIQTNIWILKKLQKLENITVDCKAERSNPSGVVLVAGTELFIPLAGLIDFDKERAKIQKEIVRLIQFRTSLQNKLNNERFVSNAPEQVIAMERKKLADTESSLSKLHASLAELT